MDLSRFVNALREDLAAVAGLGDEATAQAGARLAAALQNAVALRVLDALSEAARELNAQLPGGRVEVRLVGQDPEFVFVADEESEPAAPAEEAYTARITLRLPEGLKVTVEAAASREGVSTNTWLVRAIARAVGGRASRSRNRLTGFAQD